MTSLKKNELIHTKRHTEGFDHYTIGNGKAHLYIADDDQVSLIAGGWYFVLGDLKEFPSNISFYKIAASIKEENYISIMARAVNNMHEERNILAARIMECDEETLMRLKLFLG